MHLRGALVIFLAFTILSCGEQASTPSGGMRKITLRELKDRIRGGWAGQMIGVTYGGPTEFRHLQKMIEDAELPHDPVSKAIDQDDLYVEMTFAEVMDRVGLDATTEQYGEAFRDSQYRLWHANAAARRALVQGVRAPDSGHPRYNLHANDIDFQIEADFIGLMAPGLPQESNKFCDRVGRVMNFGDGLYGGMFVTAMYTEAFFEHDPRRIVETGLAAIPAESGYARLITDVLEWSRQNPDDWKKVWTLIQEKWDRDDPCPDGALRPFNIDARLNGAYIALGLLYGNNFMGAVDVSTRCGQDSDCNPSNAAGIWGVMIGYEALPEKYRKEIEAIAEEKFSFTNYSFNSIVESTLERAKKVIVQAGGKITDTEAWIPAQAPQAPPLETWDPGTPTRLILHDDSSWSWKGAWHKPENPAGRIASAAGAEATCTFEGTGVALVGRYSTEGGKADIFLDGEKQATVDAWVVERTNDNDLWHRFDLAPGKHELRVVVRGEKNPQSGGTAVNINRLISYQREG